MTAIKSNGRQFLQQGVLIPFWTLGWLLEIAVLACVSTVFFGVWPGSIGFLDGGYIWQTWYFNGQMAAGLLLTCPSVFILLRIGPVVLFSQQRLSPLGYFFFELPQVLIWPIVWVWSLIAVHDNPNILPVFFLCGFLQAIYMGSAIYSCVILDQWRVWRSQNKKLKSRPEAAVRVNPESMLVQEELTTHRYASAPIVDDDEEVPVSPRHSILPTYDEARSGAGSCQSFMPADEKPKASRKF